MDWAGRKKSGALLAGLFLAYAAVLLRVRGDFELTSDDGSWVRLARELVKGGDFPLFGLRSSQGIPNSAYAIYLHALSYWLVPGFAGVILGVGLFVLATHALLIRVGNRAGVSGMACSLLFFFTPAFFVFYNQKLWQVCYLPFFITLTLFFAQRYFEYFRARWLVATFFCAGLCSGFHFSGFWLLPAVVLLPLLAPPERHARFSAVLASGVGLCFALTPTLLWCAMHRPSFVTPALAAFFAALFLYWLGPRAPRLVHQALVWVLPTACLGCSWLLGARHSALEGIWGFLDLLPARSPYLEAHVGTGSWNSLQQASFARAISAALLLVTLFLAGSVRRWSTIPPFERFLFYSLWIPLWLFVGSPAFFSEFPHQWYVFLFPGAILAQLLALRGLGKLRVAVVAALLIVSLHSDFKQMKFVEASGGVSWHLASVDSKLAALREVFALSPGARVFAAVNLQRDWWNYDLEGWREAAAQTRPPAIPGPHLLSPTSAVYLFEPGAFFADDNLRKRIEAARPVIRHSARGVEVFEFAGPLPGVGIEL